MPEQQELLPPQKASAEKPAVELVPTPMSILQMAVTKGADMTTIERLVALQEHMMARDAESAFTIAMNEAQAEMSPVRADLENPQTKSRYASYATLDKRVRPIYSHHGFSLSFDTTDATKPECVRVLCYCSHRAGHTRTYKVDVPADGKGAKGGDVMTKTHATGAAMSYGMRYLLKFIFNIAIGEDDTDGNDVEYANITEQCEYLHNAKDMRELQEMFTSYYQTATRAKNTKAMGRLIAAKDARKKELQCA